MCMKIRLRNLAVYSLLPFSSQSHVKNRVWEVCRIDLQAEEKPSPIRDKKGTEEQLFGRGKDIEKETTRQSFLNTEIKGKSKRILWRKIVKGQSQGMWMTIYKNQEAYKSSRKKKKETITMKPILTELRRNFYIWHHSFLAYCACQTFSFNLNSQPSSPRLGHSGLWVANLIVTINEVNTLCLRLVFTWYSLILY